MPSPPTPTPTPADTNTPDDTTTNPVEREENHIREAMHIARSADQSAQCQYPMQVPINLLAEEMKQHSATKRHLHHILTELQSLKHNCSSLAEEKGILLAELHHSKSEVSKLKRSLYTSVALLDPTVKVTHALPQEDPPYVVAVVLAAICCFGFRVPEVEEEEDKEVEKEPAEFTLMVERVADLSSADLLHSDMYVVVIGTGVRLETTVRHLTMRPIWDECFPFFVASRLRLEVRSRGFRSRSDDVLLGHTVLSSERCKNIQNTQSFSLPLILGEDSFLPPSMQQGAGGKDCVVGHLVVSVHPGVFNHANSDKASNGAVHLRPHPATFEEDRIGCAVALSVLAPLIKTDAADCLTVLL